MPFSARRQQAGRHHPPTANDDVQVKQCEWSEREAVGSDAQGRCPRAGEAEEGNAHAMLRDGGCCPPLAAMLGA